MEIGDARNGQRIADCWSVLLPSAGLGCTDQFDHGVGGLCDGIVVDARNGGTPVEKLAVNACCYMVCG